MSKKGKILAVDDNLAILQSLEQLLKFDFEQIKTIQDPNHLLNSALLFSADVILLDMNFSKGERSGEEGLYWLEQILKIDANAVVVLITAYAEINLAVNAIKQGGTEFVVKPWDPAKLITTLKACVKLKKSNNELVKLKNRQKIFNKFQHQNQDPLIGSSDIFLQRMQELDKIAQSNANILIQGENGTGKELFAREIQKKSDRKDEAFISVDLGALSETIIESELFGHVQGAFTDAKDEKTGYFEAASEGTLFLDEIGNISLNLQSKLLHVLQNKEIMKVGSNIKIPIDFRLICATNKDLLQMVKDGLFREDLYYRINTIQFNTPALKERNEDITLLAEYFLKKHSDSYKKGNLRFNLKALDKLQNYYWPGNVRELKHLIERTVILSERSIIGPENIQFSIISKEKDNAAPIKSLAEIEKETIEKALISAKQNMSRAAKILDISRTTLYSKMKKHGL